MTILFISDTHINRYTDDGFIIQQLIIDTIEKYNNISAIYFLGDIFNFWINDEEIKTPRLFLLTNFLRHLPSSIKIYFMHGNRDFLAREVFADYIHAKIIQDPYLLIVDDKKILLSHGDILCTDDKSYQIMRKIFRNKIVQKVFFMLPVAWRLKLAQMIRRISSSQNMPNKQEQYNEKKDVSLSAIQNLHKKYSFDILIHGHTHKPSVYNYDNYKRFVLSDWDINTGGVYAVFEKGNLNLLTHKNTST